MQVVSGSLTKQTVHFEAPPRSVLKQELQRFIDWFNRTADDPSLDPWLRAAIIHLWFVTLHPFDDGNGRLVRALTDMALAQADNQSIRLYAMSVAILNDRKAITTHWKRIRVLINLTLLLMRFRIRHQLLSMQRPTIRLISATGLCGFLKRWKSRLTMPSQRLIRRCLRPASGSGIKMINCLLNRGRC